MFKGNHIRDLTYVDDIVSSIFKLIVSHRYIKFKMEKTIDTTNPSSSSAPFEIYNIGNNDYKFDEVMKFNRKRIGEKSKQKICKISEGRYSK